MGKEFRDFKSYTNHETRGVPSGEFLTHENSVNLWKIVEGNEGTGVTISRVESKDSGQVIKEGFL